MPPARSILIIEDEPLIAMMLEDFLDSLGHSVTGSADSVAAALDQVAGGSFDLAILDVHLRGGEASWAVADALADRGLPFVLSTGGQVEPTPERHGRVPVLAKPFTLDGVRQCLDDLC